MAGEATRFAAELDYIGRRVLIMLDDLPDTELNRSFPTAESHSLFALAVHLVETGEFWILTLVGNRAMPYGRSAEFFAKGTRKDLVTRYERWLTMLHEVLDDLPDSTLDQFRIPPVVTGNIISEGLMTVRDCLLQAIRYTSLLLEHMQIVRRVLNDGQ